MKSKLVIDTNILVSAMITNGGICHRVVTYAFRHSTWVICAEVTLEYTNVLRRKEFGSFSEDAESLLADVAARCVSHPAQTAPWDCKDASDQIFLNLAFTARADYLITGNTKDYPTTKNLPVKIIKPADFLKAVG